MTDSTVWIKDLLDAAEKKPFAEAVRLIEQCGKSCALRKGHVESIKQLRAAASWCKTRSEYAQFLKEHISERVIEDEDGIQIPHDAFPI